MPPSPDDFPAPGEAAARVTDADLVGCKLGQCQSAAGRYRLSPRERDILFLSLCDLRPGEIAARLGCRTSYVRRIRQTVARKFGVFDGILGIRKSVWGNQPER